MGWALLGCRQSIGVFRLWAPRADATATVLGGAVMTMLAGLCEPVNRFLAPCAARSPIAGG